MLVVKVGDIIEHSWPEPGCIGIVKLVAHEPTSFHLVVPIVGKDKPLRNGAYSHWHVGTNEVTRVLCHAEGVE